MYERHWTATKCAEDTEQQQRLTFMIIIAQILVQCGKIPTQKRAPRWGGKNPSKKKNSWIAHPARVSGKRGRSALRSYVSPRLCWPIFFLAFLKLVFLTIFWQTLRGPFSAVSTPNCASMYYVLVWKFLTRSARFTNFCTAPNSRIHLDVVKHFRMFALFFKYLV